MSSLVIVQVASPPMPTVICAPFCEPPTHVQSDAAYPAGPDSPSANAPACSVGPESTGVTPVMSFAPAPSAVSVNADASAVPPLSFTTSLRRCSCGAMSSLVIVQVASPPMPTVIFAPSWVPPTQFHALAAYPAWPVSDSTHVSAFRPAPESTGLVPDRSFEPAPSAVSVKSEVVAVPPLSLTTTLRRCSFGAMSSLVIVQVADWL